MRSRNPMKLNGHSFVILPVIRELETGECEMAYTDETKASLPDVSTTNLKDLLEAGVNLKEVDSRLFHAKDIVLHADDEPALETTETQTIKE